MKKYSLKILLQEYDPNSSEEKDLNQKLQSYEYYRPTFKQYQRQNSDATQEDYENYIKSDNFKNDFISKNVVRNQQNIYDPNANQKMLRRKPFKNADDADWFLQQRIQKRWWKENSDQEFFNAGQISKKGIKRENIIAIHNVVAFNYKKHANYEETQKELDNIYHSGGLNNPSNFDISAVGIIAEEDEVNAEISPHPSVLRFLNSGNLNYSKLNLQSNPFANLFNAGLFIRLYPRHISIPGLYDYGSSFSNETDSWKDKVSDPNSKKRFRKYQRDTNNAANLFLLNKEEAITKSREYANFKNLNVDVLGELIISNWKIYDVYTAFQSDALYQIIHESLKNSDKFHPDNMHLFFEILFRIRYYLERKIKVYDTLGDEYQLNDILQIFNNPQFPEHIKPKFELDRKNPILDKFKKNEGILDFFRNNSEDYIRWLFTINQDQKKINDFRKIFMIKDTDLSTITNKFNEILERNLYRKKTDYFDLHEQLFYLHNKTSDYVTYNLKQRDDRIKALHDEAIAASQKKYEEEENARLLQKKLDDEMLAKAEAAQRLARQKAQDAENESLLKKFVKGVFRFGK